MVIFVFKLIKDNRAAVVDVMFHEDRHHFFKPVIHAIEKLGFRRTVRHSGFDAHPCRHSSSVNFGADIRPQPEKNIHPDLLDLGKIGVDIDIVFKMKLAFGRLVGVPENVYRNGVVTLLLHAQKPIVPQPSRNAPVFHFTGKNEGRFPFDDEAVTVIGGIRRDCGQFMDKRVSCGNGREPGRNSYCKCQQLSKLYAFHIMTPVL